MANELLWVRHNGLHHQGSGLQEELGTPSFHFGRDAKLNSVLKLFSFKGRVFRVPGWLWSVTLEQVLRELVVIILGKDIHQCIAYTSGEPGCLDGLSHP